MKNIIVIALLLINIIATAQENKPVPTQQKPDAISGATRRNPYPELPKQHLTIIMLDYETLKAEGYLYLPFPVPVYEKDNKFPVDVVESKAGDFGNVLITRMGTSDTLIMATKVWMGKGKVLKPSAWVTEKLEKQDFAVDFNGKIEFLQHEPDKKNVMEKKIWNSVKNLPCTAYYYNRQFKVAAYIYQPILGKGANKEIKIFLFINGVY